MAFLGEINDVIIETEFFFNLRVIGNATSDFVFERLFKLRPCETIKCTNIKLGTINYHSVSSVIMDLMMTCLNLSLPLKSKTLIKEWLSASKPVAVMVTTFVRDLSTKLF